MPTLMIVEIKYNILEMFSKKNSREDGADNRDIAMSSYNQKRASTTVLHKQ